MADIRAITNRVTINRPAVVGGAHVVVVVHEGLGKAAVEGDHLGSDHLTFYPTDIQAGDYAFSVAQHALLVEEIATAMQPDLLARAGWIAEHTLRWGAAGCSGLR